jgi:hypothetical protein
MSRWEPTVLWERPSAMARAPRSDRHGGAVVAMPAQLTGPMRRTIQSFCPDLSDEAMELLWERLKRHKVRQRGDGAEKH